LDPDPSDISFTGSPSKERKESGRGRKLIHCPNLSLTGEYNFCLFQFLSYSLKGDGNNLPHLYLPLLAFSSSLSEKRGRKRW
jgi:hypothetical protein